MSKRPMRAHVCRLALACACASTVLTSAEDVRARDPICRAAPAVDEIESISAALSEADAAVSEADRPRARALYLAVLARDPADEEAAVGLARLDARDGCYALAEQGYRDVLARSPGNVDARAGLADVLAWTGRWVEARTVLDEGLARAPLSPDLLTRRARIAYWSGDVGEARRFLKEAERITPLDPEIRDAKDRIFLGQARIGHRAQRFPSGFDDFHTTDISAMQRWRRLRFELGLTVMSRQGATRDTRSGPMKTTIIDGRPSAGAYLHFPTGAWLGGSVAVSAPALALPRYALAVAGHTPLGLRFSVQGTAAFWSYEGDRDVVILSPAVGVALAESVDVTARYWMTSVVVHDGSPDDGLHVAHSAGARVAYRPDARTALGVDYTYGVQLERNPSASELLSLRSHIVTLLGQRLLTRKVGFDLALSLERRESSTTGNVALGPAIEAGVFTRW